MAGGEWLLHSSSMVLEIEGFCISEHLRPLFQNVVTLSIKLLPHQSLQVIMVSGFYSVSFHFPKAGRCDDIAFTQESAAGHENYHNLF
ncbi:hypothetical protein DKX38_010930 [Salix brachista]|uniref:Uncharacterized protein n=1 Tax=Salix brachista TaxID=2182728 RepID=A0A5N5LXJ4_9ROSI|nr:hypothetical protein DKX38_010930 [Salix brachista]